MKESAESIQSKMRSYGYNVEKVHVNRESNANILCYRISIEWNYSTTASVFKFLVASRKLKDLESSTVSRIYILLQPYYITLYGCQSFNYFEVILPDDML